MIHRILVVEGKLEYEETWSGEHWMVDGAKIEDILFELRGKNVKITIEEEPNK